MIHCLDPRGNKTSKCHVLNEAAKWSTLENVGMSRFNPQTWNFRSLEKRNERCTHKIHDKNTTRITIAYSFICCYWIIWVLLFYWVIFRQVQPIVFKCAFHIWLIDWLIDFFMLKFRDSFAFKRQMWHRNFRLLMIILTFWVLLQSKCWMLRFWTADLAES